MSLAADVRSLIERKLHRLQREEWERLNSRKRAIIAQRCQIANDRLGTQGGVAILRAYLDAYKEFSSITAEAAEYWGETVCETVTEVLNKTQPPFNDELIGELREIADGWVDFRKPWVLRLVDYERYAEEAEREAGRFGLGAQKSGAVQRDLRNASLGVEAWITNMSRRARGRVEETIDEYALSGRAQSRESLAQVRTEIDQHVLASTAELLDRPNMMLPCDDISSAGKNISAGAVSSASAGSVVSDQPIDSSRATGARKQERAETIARLLQRIAQEYPVAIEQDSDAWRCHFYRQQLESAIEKATGETYSRDKWQRTDRSRVLKKLNIKTINFFEENSRANQHHPGYEAISAFIKDLPKSSDGA